MHYKFVHILSIGLLLGFSAAAQQEDGAFEDALEQYASQTDNLIENDSRIQELNDFMTHPLNLNVATADELKSFFFLNELQIHTFLQYRKLLGPLISIYELQAVPLWDLKTIELLLPYVSLGKGGLLASPYSLRELFKKGRPSALFRYKRILEKQKGYRKLPPTYQPKYLGSPGALYFRFQYKLPRYLNVGVTAENDAGEPFSWKGQNGFDFESVHFYLENRGIIKELAIGDYKVSLGQGLINHQGLSFGKTGMVMMIDRSGKTIRPHTSAMEYGFYRGAALNIGKQKWSAMLFLSGKREDAHLLTIDSSINYFHSLQTSGYHRSLSERKNKGNIKVFSSGGNFRYDFGKGYVSFNTVYHHFSDSMKKSTQPYQQFNPQGTSMLNASMDYALYLNKLYFFGETATDKKGALATINGLLMSVDKSVDISLLYRNFSKAYTSLYARAFGEGSRPQNESGFYLGLQIHPSPGWEVSTYSDFFQSRWLRYRIDMPSAGREHFLQLSYTPSKKLKTYFRFRYKRKPLNRLIGSPMAKVEETRKQNFRAFLQWELSDFFRIRDQIEWTRFKESGQPAERGYMVYQNVRWKTNKRWSGNFRVGYFHTDGYDSRIYTFENNVRYTYYIPSFYGKGLRSYINLRVNLGRHLSLWSRIACTWYFDRETISSGWNEIDGNKKTKFTLELIWD